MSDAKTGLFAASPPLAVRMRPRTLSEIVGQRHLLRPGSPLNILADGAPNGRGSTSVILWGPPGTGKTTIAHVISRQSDHRFVELSAVSAGVKELRQLIDAAQSNRDLYGVSTVLFVDEIHRFSKAQQDALLPAVEYGWVSLVAATTENPSFSVITPLLSRSLLLALEPLGAADIGALIDRALADDNGLGNRYSVDADARDALIRLASGDARRALNGLEAAAAGAESIDHDEQRNITAELISSVADRALLRYDRNGDDHYDVISAFIKSVRGSDVDAALHYLVRMLEAGEDPRFIARRIIVLASEDIGMADPNALVVAVAAADAVQLIGMPEGRIPLAQAVVHLATAPKSNASYVALNRAQAHARSGRIGVIPKALRDSHYPGAEGLGHGTDYQYPHDSEIGVIEQQYAPDELKDVEYYRPTSHGHERELAVRLAKLRSIVHGTDAERDRL